MRISVRAMRRDSMRAEVPEWVTVRIGVGVIAIVMSRLHVRLVLRFKGLLV